MRNIGIDPGAKGGFALFEDGRLVAVARMPTVSNRKGNPRVDGAAVGYRLHQWLPLDHAYVELVGAMPGQGVSSMFTFGKAAGIVEGALGALMIPTTYIAPGQWKVALRVPAEKNGARARASQLIPSGAHYWPMAKDDGMAEAALIALYGSRLPSLAPKASPLGQEKRLDTPRIEW